jgi:xanthine dehydrogenase accessory factor
MTETTLDPEDVLGHAAVWNASGRDVALATVVSTWGSAPRPAGSLLVVNDAGEFLGSVSGGCVEHAVIAEAVSVIRNGGTRRLRFGVTSEMAWDVGLACGGDIEIFLERIDDLELLDRLMDAREERRSIALATDLESGEHWLIEPGAEASADPLEAALHSEARAAQRGDRAVGVSFGGRRLFLNIFPPPRRMIIVGAVHIAQSLARIATLTGFEVTVVDPRSAYATAMRFPGVALSAQWPGEAVAARSPDVRTAVVTLSHDPKLDDPALGAALQSEAFYIGALGSRRTHARRVERLRRAGFAEDQIARIRGPVGLPLGARTPAEIALSIVAEAIGRARDRA